MGKPQESHFIDYVGKQKAELKKVGDKYVMEFDDVPALLFVSYDGNGRMDQLFRFGEWVNDAQAISIQSELQGLTTFDVSKLALGFKAGD